MKVLIIIFIIIVIITLFKNENMFEGFTVWSRPNKCFDCEKQITSIQDAYLAFPSKCFDCEKNSQTPYLEGPSKCFDCTQQKHRMGCIPIDDGETNNFETYMRNRFINRMG